MFTITASSQPDQHYQTYNYPSCMNPDIKAHVIWVRIHSTRTCCSTAKVIEIKRTITRGAASGSAVKAVGAGGITGLALLGGGIGIELTRTHVSTVPRVKIVATGTCWTVWGWNTVTGLASRITGLTCLADLNIASGWACSHAISSCCVWQQISAGWTRRARIRRWSSACQARRITSVTTIVPGVRVSITVAWGLAGASRVIVESVVLAWTAHCSTSVSVKEASGAS